MTPGELYAIIIAIFRVVNPTMPMIVAQQNIGRTEWPQYGTMLLVSDQLIGLPETLTKDETGTLDIENIIRQRRHATFSINFYRDDTKSVLNSFMASWFSMYGIEIQRERGIGFRGFSSVRNITAAVNSNFEDRAQVDLHISYIHQFNLTHDTIGAWNIDGDFIGDNGTIPIAVNIQEPGA